MSRPFDGCEAIERLKGGLIASCQPLEGPMDRDEIVEAMAAAAVAGGAAGLRIEGVERVRRVARRCNVPVVGIVKRDLTDSDVRISPLIGDVHALADAGATIIAFDATVRARPVPAAELLARVHEAGCLAMADCSNLAEAQAMADLGCEFIASTLSGYTGGQVPAAPDLDLVRQMAAAGFRTVAEGRYNTPQLATQALASGAHAVTVGSAITRIEQIVQWFCLEMGVAAREVEQ